MSHTTIEAHVTTGPAAGAGTWIGAIWGLLSLATCLAAPAFWPGLVAVAGMVALLGALEGAAFGAAADSALAPQRAPLSHRSHGL
ncbi:hypothetical protein K2Z83_12195 [Oscillochloris sp. ZM17-4]|uniref:hypothetical protein n=1 Tax=Oscillochloris sp. ZM17-4 TaxID=2866714 RepID=UPI001C7327A7|nr:hypothetical protein [Oscillochloris sp. ZM17-4]MBX0328437.1 hypothetical protein [Oscillochloris sp. ZM17-4]